MLIQLFENPVPLLEINFEKTRDTFYKAFAKRAEKDKTCHFDYSGLRITAEQHLSLAGDSKEELLRLQRTLFDELFPILQSFDPTHGRASKPDAYVVWMIIRYIKGGIPLWEDLQTISELLAQYEEYKKYDTFKKMHRDRRLTKEELDMCNDIAKIPGQSELFEVVMAAKKWVAQNDATNIETEYRRYTDWAFKGGCKIIYPREGTSSERVSKFAKYGMVIELNTVECSIDLFEKDTAWCTARGPSNDNFEYYADQGPLIVIVDNVNGKLYQWSEGADEYHDEKNSTRYSALAIPKPLLNAAIPAAATSLEKVMNEVGDEVSHRVLTAFKKNETGDLGTKLWEQFRNDPHDFNDYDIVPIVDWYVAEQGHLPPPLEVSELCHQLEFDAGGDLVEDGVDAIRVAGVMMAFMRNPNAKPSEQTVSHLFELAKDTIHPVSILVHYFSNTPYWAKARAEIIKSLTSGVYDVTPCFEYKPWRGFSGLYSTQLAHFMPTALGSRIPKGDIRMIVGFTPQEVGAIINSAYHPSLVCDYTRRAIQNKFGAYPDVKSMATALSTILHKDLPSIVHDIFADAPLREMYAPCININTVLSAAVDDSLRHNLWEYIIESPEYQVKIDATTLNIWLKGEKAMDRWRVIHNKISEEQALGNHFNQHPELYVVAKNLLLSSLQQKGNCEKMAMFFYYEELAHVLTVEDFQHLVALYYKLDDGLGDKRDALRPEFMMEEIFYAIRATKLRLIPQSVAMELAMGLFQQVVKRRGWRDWMDELIDRFKIKLSREFIAGLYDYSGSSISHHKFIELCKKFGIALPQEYLAKVPPVGQSHSVHIDDPNPVSGHPAHMRGTGSLGNT